MWGELYRKHLEEVDKETSLGKRYTISSLIKTDETICRNVCEKIEKEKFIPTDKISTSDFIICLNEEDIDRLKMALKYPYNGYYLLLKDFLEN